MFIRTLFYLFAAYMMMVGFIYLFQRHLIYFPEQNAPSPADAGVPSMEVVTFKTDDGLTLQSWYSPPTNPNLPTIVYFHGNAGHIGHRGFIVSPLLRKGYGVFLLTYRGYSDNPGSPSEEGLYSDGRAAIKFLTDKGIPGKCTVFYGNSIGAAVAIQMATEYNPAALILQSPFTSLGEVGQYHYPILPAKLFAKDRFDSMTKVKDIQAPVLLIHGESDNIIPPIFGRELFKALPEPKEAKFIKGSGHNTLFEPSQVNHFIEKHVKC